VTFPFTIISPNIKAPLVLEYQSINWVEDTATSWDFGSLSIGAASADRTIFVIAAAGDNSGTTSGASTDLSVTIDGNAMTRNQRAALWR